MELAFQLYAILHRTCAALRQIPQLVSSNACRMNSQFANLISLPKVSVKPKEATNLANLSSRKAAGKLHSEFGQA